MQLNHGVFSHQRGVATILIMLLLGIGMVAVSAGVIHTQRSAQERQIATHAQTHAQPAAWSAVDVVRQYLGTLDSAALEALALNSEWNIDNGTETILTARLTNRIPPNAGSTAYQITAVVRATDTAARASSILEVVYAITPGSSGGNKQLEGVLDFGDDLTVSGGIEFQAPEGADGSFDIRVDGNVTVSSVSISGSGIGRLAATGDITLGSDVEADEVFANGDINITGGAQPGTIFAVGHVTMSGGTGVERVFANGNVLFTGGSARAEVSVDSLQNITIGTWSSHGILTAGNDIAISGGSAQAARAVGNIAVTGGNGVQELVSQSDVSCSQQWLSFPHIRAGGNIDCTSGDMQANINPPPPVDVMEPLQPFSMEQPEVDVWAVKDEANYIFEYEAGKQKVTVQNVSALSNGVYYLGTYNETGEREYLCTAISNNGTCTSPASHEQARTLCNGFSIYNGCFTYSQNTSEWTINGTNVAPGAFWFKGNLEVSNGEYYNTFMATGNIRTSGGTKTYAINFAGPDVICENRFPSGYTNDFAGLYPTNFCAVSNNEGSLIPNALGNIAMMAGGIEPDTEPSVFTGGLVSLGSDTEIFGTVMAGDVLGTGGSSVIHGYVAASGQGSVGLNTIGNSTTIDLRNLPPGYDPATVPDMGQVDRAAPGSATVLWSRYL